VDIIGDTTDTNSGQRALCGVWIYVCVYSLSCTYITRNDMDIIGDTTEKKLGQRAFYSACMYVCMYACIHSHAHI